MNQQNEQASSTSTPTPVTEAIPTAPQDLTKAPTTIPTQDPTKAPDAEVTPLPTTTEPLESAYLLSEDSLMSSMEVYERCPGNLLGKRDEVTYGEVIRTSYYSTTCEKDRNVIVLLPAGYTAEKKYPVLYILHGIFGNETSMIGDGNSGIRILYGNMVAEGMSKDMILVFPYMYASKDQDVCTAIDLKNTLAYDNFVNDLANDLMPYMEENYPVLTGRENTAVMGFSMGGRETLAIQFQRPDLIGYSCAIAPAPGLTPGKDFAMDHPGQFTEEELVFPGNAELPNILMVTCGTKDSVVGKFPKSYHDILFTNNVSHLWWEVTGSDHGDPAISSGYYNFLRYIFD